MNPETNTIATAPTVMTAKSNVAAILTAVPVIPPASAKSRQPRSAKKHAAAVSVATTAKS